MAIKMLTLKQTGAVIQQTLNAVLKTSAESSVSAVKLSAVPTLPSSANYQTLYFEVK